MHSETPKYTIEFIVLQMQQSSLITCNEGMKREEWLSGHIFGTLILRFCSKGNEKGFGVHNIAERIKKSIPALALQGRVYIIS